MARTPGGRALTEAHRQAQLQIRAFVLRDFIRIWPLWRGDEETFQRLLAATFPLIQANHRISSSLASTYYLRFRATEGVGGGPAVRTASPLDPDKVRGTLHLTGAEMTRRAVRAGHSPQAAMQTALTRVSGSVGRFVMAGGRETLARSTTTDRRAGGMQRVTSGNPCDFCADLAAQGPSADFEAHDHCGCSAEPFYQ